MTNYLFSILRTFLQGGIPLLISLVLGNLLAVSAYGQYVGMLLVATTIATIATIPVDSATIHFILKSRDQNVQNHKYTVGVALVCINMVFVFCVLIIGKPFLQSFFNIEGISYYGYTAIIGVTLSIVAYTFFAKLMTVRYLFKDQILILVVSTVIQFAAILYFVVNGYLEPEYFILTAFTFYISGIIFYERRLRKEFSYVVKLRCKDEVLPLLKFSSLIYLGTLTGFLDEKIDLICINAMLSKEDVAYYSYAMLISFSLYGIGLGVSQVTFPHFCRYFKNNESEKADHLYFRTLNYLFIVISFLSLLLLFNSTFIISLILPEEYLKIVPVLEIVIPGITSFAVFTGVGTTFTAAGKPLYGLWITAFFMCINLVLNLILIPKFGIVGAAIATSTTFVARSLIAHWVNKKKLGLNGQVGKLFLWYLVMIALVIANRELGVIVKDLILLLYLFLVCITVTTSKERSQLKAILLAYR